MSIIESMRDALDSELFHELMMEWRNALRTEPDRVHRQFQAVHAFVLQAVQAAVTQKIQDDERGP